ncbi:MAG: glycosyl transferase family 1, partial [Verrucomicrobiota bacterium]|nr:glycosyl transferase family 1 [Verrucomicrobiota bacterium]
MRILYLCADRGIPVRGNKGASVHVRAMANAFAHAGHAVTILTPRPGPADGPAVSAEIVEAPVPAPAAGAGDPRVE